MKNQLFYAISTFLLFCLCIVWLPYDLDGQNPPNTYFAIQYMKVHPTQENEYLELETEVWKKMHKARIEAGKLDGWYLFRVVAPVGTHTEYNFVTVNVYKTAEKLAGHFEDFGVDYTSILTPDEIASALETPKIRDLVYEEVWTSVDEIMKPNPDKIFRFQVFNAMSLREGTDPAEYQRIEGQYWKPMHVERIKRGIMAGWGMYTMIIPGGTERKFHWATVDYYDNFIDYLKDTGDIMIAVHGAKDARKYVEETTMKRDLLKAEVRELIDYAVAETVDY